MRPTPLLITISACLLLGACQKEVDPKVAALAPTVKSLKITDTTVGTGETVAKGDLVFVQYQGALKDKSIFDQNMTKGNVLSFTVGNEGPGGVIKGWNQGVVGMKVGGTRELEIPYSLGYGDAGSPPKIPAKTDLYFTIKLLYVIKPGDEEVYDKTDTTVGTGSVAKVGDKVEIHYVGKYLNGVVFDDSRKRGKTVIVKLGSKKMIPGLDAGIVGMHVGGHRKLTLPPKLVYGPGGNGSIQGNQVTIFDVDLVSVNGKK